MLSFFLLFSLHLKVGERYHGSSQNSEAVLYPEYSPTRLSHVFQASVYLHTYKEKVQGTAIGSEGFDS